MSVVKDFLLHKHAEIRQAIRAMKDDLNDISVSLAAIDKNGASMKVPSKKKPAGKSGRIAGGEMSAMILEAITNDCVKPQLIQKFLLKRFGRESRAQTISTKLTSMKEEGLIVHNKFKRWEVAKTASNTEIQKIITSVGAPLSKPVVGAPLSDPDVGEPQSEPVVGEPKSEPDAGTMATYEQPN